MAVDGHGHQPSITTPESLRSLGDRQQGPGSRLDCDPKVKAGYR